MPGEFFAVLGVVGSIASVVALLLPAQGKRQRLIHLVYGVAITVLAFTAVWYQQKLSRVNRVERAATQLVEDRQFRFSNEGFIQAALAFLEKNKDLYPDSYGRAQEICRLHKCLASQYEGDSSRSLQHAYGLIDAASALEGLLRGIADISKGS